MDVPRKAMRKVAKRVLRSRREKVAQALALLTPRDAGLRLLRLGSAGDGGYLVPDDLDGVTTLFSPGVSDNWTFESDVAGKYGIRSFMVDASVDTPQGLSDLQKFEPLWLGERTERNIISLNDWVGGRAPEASEDLLLQMDIEGAEYGVLSQASQSTLERFRIMVIEFHSLSRIGYWPFLTHEIMPVLRKLDKSFVVVHVHPNNCCPVEIIHGIPVPQVLEVTYLRRDRVRIDTLGLVKLPNSLDEDCVPELPSIVLPTDWPSAS